MEFKSKIYIENRRKNSFVRVVISTLCLVFMLLVLFKALMGDFSVSDISPLFIPLILIFGFVRGGKPYPVYADCIGKAEFESEKLRITYENVDGGKKIGQFSQTTVVIYDEIESIEFGQELQCFRIFAPCDSKRFYEKYHKEESIQNKESVNEILVYFLDEDEAKSFSKTLQIKAKRIIQYLSLQDE